MIAHEVTVLHHAGAVRRAQEDGRLHRVRLVPHIQQDHVKIEGGIRGNEARCGEAAKAKFTEVPIPSATPLTLAIILPSQAVTPHRALYPSPLTPESNNGHSPYQSEYTQCDLGQVTQPL